MNIINYIKNLEWLPDKGKIPKQAKILNHKDLILLSRRQLNWQSIQRLEKIIELNKENLLELKELEKVKVWLTGNVTLDFLKSAIVAVSPRFNIYPEIYISEFDQIVQPFLDKSSNLYHIKPDIICIYLDVYFDFLKILDNEKVESLSQKILDDILLILKIAKEDLNATVLITTTPEPCEVIYGNLESQISSTNLSLIRKFNSALSSLSESNNLLIIDLAYWANLVGLISWRSPTLWFKAKIPYSLDLNHLISDLITRKIAALKGRSKKCLILDLDNTLWGGQIGDDDLDGIKIGNNDPIGESYLVIQQIAKKLKNRGIILAVSSKNNHDIALEPFKIKKEMILNLDDISIFKINWNNKADNIKLIARELNIGLDSMVFFDDNPAERYQVSISEYLVDVPELPNDSSYYPLALMAAGYFETIRITDEDKLRSKDYISNTKRIELKEESADLHSYLLKLGMKIIIKSIDEKSIKRTADLFAKTNQFNFSYIRYTEEELKELINSNEIKSYTAQLKDKFGDIGIISALILQKFEKYWEIKNWVMSCRVFGRQVEDEIFRKITKDALEAGIKKIKLQYSPQKKNKLLIKIVEDIGFTKTNKNGDLLEFEIDICNYKNKISVFNID